MEDTEAAVQLALPPALAAEVDAAAAAEHRSALEVIEDAVKAYVRAKRWQRTLAYGQSRSQALGLTEEDVPSLIAESREEQRRAG
jgi:metal-responsive CopG/Arc/MetJ family transcriptional regulator